MALLYVSSRGGKPRVANEVTLVVDVAFSLQFTRQMATVSLRSGAADLDTGCITKMQQF